MAKKEQPSRELQIEMMTDVAQRQSSYLNKWLSDPEFKAALRRETVRHGEDTRPLRRAIAR